MQTLDISFGVVRVDLIWLPNFLDTCFGVTQVAMAEQGLEVLPFSSIVAQITSDLEVLEKARKEAGGEADLEAVRSNVEKVDTLLFLLMMISSWLPFPKLWPWRTTSIMTTTSS